MATTRYFRFARSLFISGVLAMLIFENASNADEVPAFFLKIAKNIPRVGRSDSYEDIFKSRQNILKSSGRDSGLQPEFYSSYNGNEPFSSPIKRRVDYPVMDDEWTWQHFPLAIEGPRELWRTLAGYSKDISDDIDNEVWKRKKRTESEAVKTEEN